MEWGVSLAPDSWLNSNNSVGESSEVSQEDLVRVSENARKAALIWWQIRDDQQKNNQLAKFLEFLFSEVKNDHVWELIVSLCTVQDSTWRGLTLSLHEMIAIFAPFFPDAIEEYGINTVIHDLPHVESLQIDTYSNYIHILRKKYPLIHSMDTTILAKLIIALLEYFDYIRILEEQRQETIDSIKGFIGMN